MGATLAGMLTGCAPAIGPEPRQQKAERGYAHAPVAAAAACPSGVSMAVETTSGHAARLETLRDRVRERRAAGTASAAEVAQVEARLARARARLARVRGDLAVSRAALTEAIGQAEACLPKR